MMEGIGVVIADDHPMVLDGLCGLIDGTPDLRVVASEPGLLLEHRTVSGGVAERRSRTIHNG